MSEYAQKSKGGSTLLYPWLWSCNSYCFR